MEEVPILKTSIGFCINSKSLSKVILNLELNYILYFKLI